MNVTTNADDTECSQMNPFEWGVQRIVREITGSTHISCLPIDRNHKIHPKPRCWLLLVRRWWLLLLLHVLLVARVVVTSPSWDTVCSCSGGWWLVPTAAAQQAAALLYTTPNYTTKICDSRGMEKWMGNLMPWWGIYKLSQSVYGGTGRWS